MALNSEPTCFSTMSTKTKQLEIRDLKAYLLSLPRGVLQKLYCHPTPCLAVFRQLPRICQLWVMRMLFIDRPIPQTSISSWIKAEYQKSYSESLDVLSELQLWRECYLAGGVTACQLTDSFRANLQVVLIGGGSGGNELIPIDAQQQDGGESKPAGSRDMTQHVCDYGRTRWSAVLHYMVGTTTSANTSDQTTSVALLEQSINVLKYAQLIDDSVGGGGSECGGLTSAGFQFLLLDTRRQLWYFLQRYLDMVQQGAGGAPDITRYITFLMQLSFSTRGKSYSTEGMSEDLLTFLQHLREFGLIYMRKRSCGRFYPTPLCHLVSEAMSGVSSVDGGLQREGYVVVETNFRVYAYTDQHLNIAILSLFTQLIARFPNLVVGQLTRESVREALRAGITARQIILYLSQHAHPNMYTTDSGSSSGGGGGAATSVLPPDVCDQIRLWELELSRFTFQESVLYSQFLSQADYDLLSEYAKDLGVLVHENPARRMLLVTPPGHDALRKFWKRQKKSAAAGTGQGSAGMGITGPP